MDKLLTERAKDLIDLVEQFGKCSIEPISLEYDKSGKFPAEQYKEAFDMGLHLLDIPEEYGGSGVSAEEALMMCEKLSMYDAGFATGVFAVGLAAKAMMVGGTPEQIKRFTDILAEGKFAAFALTEANAGSDAGATRTKAVLDGDEYVINGSKCFITNGGVADVYVVIASTDSSQKTKGLSAFMVERSRGGISVGNEEDKMGIRLSNTTEVVFDNVRVPKENLLGKEGDGFKIAMKTLDKARPTAAAGSVGIAQRCIDLCKKYMMERKTFGKPIAAYQALQFKLADMEIKTETARQYVRYCGRLIDANESYAEEAAIAKCFASDIANEVAIEAVQSFGGYGYSREYPLEKLMRDAKIFQIFEGTNEIQRMVIASSVIHSK